MMRYVAAAKLQYIIFSISFSVAARLLEKGGK